MFSTTGFTLLTFIVLLGGIATHSLKQFVTARVNKAEVTAGSYYGKHWPETAIAVIGSLVLWGGLPELVVVMPEFSATIGLGSTVGIFSSFLCGFVGNSLADLFGSRARSVAIGS